MCGLCAGMTFTKSDLVPLPASSTCTLYPEPLSFSVMKRMACKSTHATPPCHF